MSERTPRHHMDMMINCYREAHEAHLANVKAQDNENLKKIMELVKSASAEGNVSVNVPRAMLTPAVINALNEGPFHVSNAENVLALSWGGMAKPEGHRE